MADKPGSKFNFKRPGGSPLKKPASSDAGKFSKPGAKKPVSGGGSRFTKPGTSAGSASADAGAKNLTKPGFSFKKPEKSKTREKETTVKPEAKKPSVGKNFARQPKTPAPARREEEKEESQPEKQPVKRKWNFGPKTLKKEPPEETDKTPAVSKEAAPDPGPPPAAVPEEKTEKEEPQAAQAEIPKAPKSAEKAIRDVNVSELISSQTRKAQECAAPFTPLEEKPPSPFGSPLDIFERNKLQEQTGTPANISPDLHYREQIEIWAQRFKDDLDRLVDAYAGNLVSELDKIFREVKVPSRESRPEIDTEEIKKRVASAEEFIEEELKSPEQKGFMAFMKKAKQEAEKLRERERALKK